MDALSDPRAYLSMQEKRAEQLKAMGIEESDISTDGVIITHKTGSASTVVPGLTVGKKNTGIDVRINSVLVLFMYSTYIYLHALTSLNYWDMAEERLLYIFMSHSKLIWSFFKEI